MEDLVMKESKEILEMIKEEYNKISNIRSTYYEEDFYYNNETKETEIVYTSSYDKIIKAYKEKIENITEEDIESRVYTFDVKKIHSYNDLFNLKIINNKVIIKHNDLYEDYKKELSELFDLNNSDGELKKFLLMDNIKICIEFHINYRQKDVDNITKPFIDCLFFNVGISDNRITEIYNSKKIKNEENNEEFIKFKIKKMKREELERCLF